jgi:hypothetical protein
MQVVDDGTERASIDGRSGPGPVEEILQGGHHLRTAAIEQKPLHLAAVS